MIKTTIRTFALATLTAIAALLSGCKDEDKAIGVEIQPQEDQIIVAADTFIIQSENYYVPAISTKPTL